VAVVEQKDFLDLLAADAAAIVAAGRRGDPAASVPGCPDWNLDDLLWHVGDAYHFWEFVARTRVRPDDYVEPSRPDSHDELLAWLTERADALHARLETEDPATKVWTWSSGDDIAWITRRMAHESAVHRVDAEAATGVDFRIAPPVAADGIDEFLTYFLGDRFADPPQAVALGGSVHLHCTDTDGEWTVVDGAPGQYVVAREHAKGDAALRGEADALLRVLWGRQPLEAVTVFGDADVVARLLAAASTD
jgi:uncharacterized protein (TIGR03083 family)